jgi:hypothetical protein
MEFKITVKHIAFTTNQYFLANSHYVIFRKENKSKQFVSRYRVLTANDLKMVEVNEKIKFRSCMFQDLAHRYLEKYLPKDKRFLVRQVTCVSSEELYVNCGYFELPLNVYAMQPSGQDVVANFVDPNGMASGTVYLHIEHESGQHMHNHIPNFSKGYRKMMAKNATKQPLPPSRLAINQAMLEFVKRQQIEHHWSHKYDGMSSDSEDEDTHSESDVGSEISEVSGHLPTGTFTQSFIMNRTGMPQRNTKGESSKNYESFKLDPHMFHFEGVGGEGLTSAKAPPENSFAEEEEEPTSPTTRMVTFEDENIEINPDLVSTLSHSSKDTATAHERGHVVVLPRGNTRIPFAGESYKARADAALEGEDDEDEVKEIMIVKEGKVLKEVEAPAPAVVAAVSVEEEEELWEDPAGFDLLPPTQSPGTHLPRKSLRNAPPPIITDASKFIPARTVPRLPSANNFSLEQPVKQPATAVSTHVHTSPHHELHRSTSESSLLAQMSLNMQSEDDGDVIQRKAKSGEHDVPAGHPSHNVAPRRVTEKTGVKAIRSSLPNVRQMVPVRLTATDSATAQATSQAAAHSSAQAHKHTHHRASSTGDMYTELSRPQKEFISPVSVKEIRRNFEKSQTDLRGNYDMSSPPVIVSPSNASPGSANISFQRSNSERSYSTLSTHDNLPKKATGGPSRILVPVRLQSATQEQAYRSDLSPREIPLAPYRSRSPAREQPGEHHLHRASTGIGSRPYESPRREPYREPYREPVREQPREQTREHHLHRAHSGGSSRPLEPPFREPIREAPTRGEQHALHREHSGVDRQKQDPYKQTRPLQHSQSQFSGEQAFKSREYEREHARRQESFQARREVSPTPASATAHAPILHRVHSMAPPIRLKPSDYVPPAYERYVETIHVEHHHHPNNNTNTNHHNPHNDHNTHNVYNNNRDNCYSPREEGYYSHGQAPRHTPEAYRGVYA